MKVFSFFNKYYSFSYNDGYHILDEKLKDLSSLKDQYIYLNQINVFKNKMQIAKIQNDTNIKFLIKNINNYAQELNFVDSSRFEIEYNLIKGSKNLMLLSFFISSILICILITLVFYTFSYRKLK